MQTLMIPFTPRYFVLTACALLTVVLFVISLESLKAFEIVIIPLLIFGALTLVGIRDLTQKRHAVLRNYPISAHLRFLLESIRPEMRQYFFESEKDGTPFSRDAAGAGLSARQDRSRQASVRHPVQRLPGWLRVGAPLDRAEADRDGEVSHHRRRAGLQEALFGVGLQHLGDELRLAQRQRDPRAERRRQEGQFRARHRRGRRQPVPQGNRRRPDLGDRLRLFRLPHARRQVRSGEVRQASPRTTRSR